MATIRIVGPRFIQEFVLGHSFSDVMKSKIEEDPKSTSQVVSQNQVSQSMKKSLVEGIEVSRHTWYR